MADNVAITAGSGTTIAADDVGAGVLHQRVKVTWGPDGTGNDTDVASGKSLPVQMRVSDGTAWTYGAGAVSAGTPRVTHASDDPLVTALGSTALDLGKSTGGSRTLRVAIDTSQVAAAGTTYETVAASQTGQVLGPGSGATGDYISGVLVVPATTSPGNVLLLDNATSITIFTGGASSVSNLVPFFIPLGMVSQSGAWKLTTGANVSCIGVGTFT